MNKHQRLYRFHELLKNARYPVSREKLMEELKCSRSTLYRLKSALEFYGAPVESNKHGFYYDKDYNFELPGLILSSEEIRGLLMVDHLLQDIQGESLKGPLQRLLTLIEDLLETSGYRPRSVQIIRALARPVPDQTFHTVFEAIQKQKQLRFNYHARSTGKTSQRRVSPQRLTSYRNAWYLDAWCHQARDFRSFALEQMENIEKHPEPATLFDEEKLNAHFSGAYGIFAGEPDKTAVLAFSERVKPWVEKERWHSRQKLKETPNGGIELHLPYHHDTELLMDILRYGADVVVKSPPELRQRHQDELRRALAHYTGTK